MARMMNPFGLIIEPEPDPSISGDRRHTAMVTIPANGFIPAHYHKCDLGLDSLHDHANAEIYHWHSGGTLHLFIRENEDSLWRHVELGESNRTIAILAGWHHGAVAYGEGVVFHALSRVDHFRPFEQGGNVHRLPDKEQPLEILQVMNFWASNL